MPIVATILTYIGAALLALALAGIIVRRRYREWFFLAIFVALTLASTVMMLAWPARFYNSVFWQANETAHNLIRFAMALELAWRTFRAFPGALATARWALLSVLVVTLLAVVAVSGLGTNYESFLAQLHPRVLNGSIWVFTAIAGLILWYRLPVNPFHKAVLLGYVPYLLVFTVTMNVLGSLGREHWERATAVLYANQVAYLALIAHWARAAWRRVEVPTRPPELREATAQVAM
jgi:hypothetical protein